MTTTNAQPGSLYRPGTPTPIERPAPTDGYRFANARAQARFDASGIDPKYAPVIAQDAHYMMNHVGVRFSEAVESCCQFFAVSGPASPMARAMRDEIDAD